MSKITQRKKRIGGKRKRGGTLKRKKSSAVLSDNMSVDKKPKVATMGLQLNVGEAEKVRAEMIREDDDKLFLQEQYNKNIQKIEDNKKKKLYLSPLIDPYKSTYHNQIKRTPEKMYDEWNDEDKIGAYGEASYDGLTDSSIKPRHKRITYYDDERSIKREPQNLFKGGIREVNKKCSRKSRSKKCLRKSRSKKHIKKYTKKRKVGGYPSQKVIELNKLIIQQIRSKLSSSLTIPLKDNESFPDKSLVRAFSSIYKKNKDEFDSYTGDDIVTIYRKWRQGEASGRLNLRDIARSDTKPTKIMATKRKSEQHIYNEMLKSIEDDEIMDKGLESQFSYIHEPSSPMKTIPDIEETPWSSTRIDKTNIKSLDHERELLEKVSSTNLFAPRKSRRVNLTNNNEQPNRGNNLFSTNTNLSDLKDYDNINPNVNMYNDNIANDIDIDNELASELFDEISNSKISHKK